jgi:prepilin-type N-terminal cleavage/methylation domain-containing protein
MLQRGRTNRRGFNLVETIAAVVILSIAIPAMLWSIQQAQVQRVGPVQASKARWLAAEKIEDIIADRHSPTRGYGHVTAANYPAENAVTGFPGFSRSVTITETGSDLTSAGSGYKRVTVSVAWTDAMNVPRTLSVSTVVTNY